MAAEVSNGRLLRVLPRYRLMGGGLFIVWPTRTMVPARVGVVREFLARELASLKGEGI